MKAERGNVWGFTQFADDLRNEVGGKVSVMGIYLNDLIVNGPAPVMLPKLVILVHYYENINTIDSDLVFKVSFPGVPNDDALPILEQTYKRTDLPKLDPAQEAALRADEGDEPFYYLRVPFILAPFPILAEGQIKVRCHYDDGSVLKLGRLALNLRKPTSAPTAS